jgi:hypothetical protein
MKSLTTKILLSLLIFIGAIYILTHSSQEPQRPIIRELSLKVITPNSPEFYPGRIQNGIINARSTVNGKEVYNKKYIFDNNYNRKLEKNNLPKKKHILLDGCSYTFGEGLDKTETLDYFIQKIDNKLDVTNISIMGGSPHLSLFYHKNINLSDLSAYDEGYYFFIFIVDQLFRWRLDFTYLDWASPGYPYFNATNSSLEYKGKLKDNLSYRIFHNLKKIKINPYLFNTSPRTNVTDDDLLSFSLAINELKKSYLKSYPKGKFIFMMHPLTEPPEGLLPRLEKTIKDTGVRFINPSSAFLFQLENNKKMYEEYTIQIDGHPNGLLNEWFANWIVDNEASF